MEKVVAGKWRTDDRDAAAVGNDGVWTGISVEKAGRNMMQREFVLPE